MIDIEYWLDLFGLTGQHLLAMTLGAAISVCVTQGAKVAGEFGGWPAFWIALLAGFLPAYTIAPPVGFGFSWTNLWLGILSGLAATRIYKTARAVIAWRYPEIADQLRGGK